MDLKNRSKWISIPLACRNQLYGIENTAVSASQFSQEQDWVETFDMVGKLDYELFPSPLHLTSTFKAFLSISIELLSPRRAASTAGLRVAASSEPKEKGADLAKLCSIKYHITKLGEAD